MKRVGIVLALLAGCGFDSASDPQLLVPDDLVLHWDRSFNEADDGIVALVPIDVMVYDGASGEPLEGVALELHGSDPGALLALPPAIALAGGGDSDFAWWDTWRDRYFFLADDPELEPATALETETDHTGLARVYVLVDRFPTEGGAFVPAAVTVSMGMTEESFFLVPR